MNEFSLTELIESVQDDAGPDAHDIAAKVEPLIPEAHRHEVFLLALAHYIRSMKPRISSVAAQPAGSANSAGSAKVAAYRGYARFLRLRVNVGRGQDKWMADCTYADLQFAAEQRRSHAAETIAAAEEYEALAALLKRRKAATVSALPEADIERFLSRRQVAA